MSVSAFFTKIDNALLARAPLSAIRGMLFGLLDQVEALEENLRSLERGRDDDVLCKENDRLRANLAKAQASIERLGFEAYDHDRKCSEAQNGILYCIACLGSHTREELVETLNFGGESIHFHLSELQKIGYLGLNHEFQWDILRHGLRYLREQGILKR